MNNNEGIPPSRLAAFFLLVIGLGLGYWQYTMIHNQGKFYDKVIALVFLCSAIGIAAIIQPKLLNPWHSQYTDSPGMGKYKILTVVFAILVTAIALYFVLALKYGWWIPDFLDDLLS